MSKILRLYNTFARSINEVELGGKIITAGQNEVKHASMYICGPTVYSHSHMGHALTYVRADLFRRMMKSIFNVKLITTMNITDVDDKILAKAQEELEKGRSNAENIHNNSSVMQSASISTGKSTTDKQQMNIDFTQPDKHPFNRISEKYYRSFLDDMELIRVQPPDLTIKVTKQVQLIVDYIKRLEQRGHAYVADNGDVYFRVASVENYEGKVDSRKSGNSDPSKRDTRDFVLWKAAKPNEPVWMYQSDVSGRLIPGRPGWHVQCSAISNLVFGSRLDFHYGGKDLIFPHHYNEEACCCAYHNLDTSKTLHAWSKNWLHSGHLVFREEKMSKSLGNVVAIKSFINGSSVNALRLLCITNHYRSNVEFSQDLIDSLKLLDHKLKAFTSYLNEEIIHIQNEGLLAGGMSCEELTTDNTSTCCDDRDISLSIHKTHEDIIEGICDDLDLDKGLQSILNLSKLIYAKGSVGVGAKNLVCALQLMKDWCKSCGLEYGSTVGSPQDELLLDIVQNYRHNVRSLVVSELKNKQPDDSSRQALLQSLLAECDNIRARLDELGLVIRDKKT